MNKRLVSIICAAALFTQTLPTNAIATTIEDAFIKKGLNSEVDKDKSDSNSEESSSKDENETSQDNKLKEEELGLDKVKFNAYIDKTDQLLFSIGFDEKEKKFTVSEQSEKNISEETPEETMYTIKIFDKEQKEKFSVELKGKDTGNSEKLEPLKSLNYEVGDFIQITPTDSKDVLKITGNIQGDVDKQKEDYSDGIDNYDYIGNVRFQVEEDHLKTVYNEAPVINGLTDIEESENPMNDILTGISIKDDHDGDIDNSKIVPLITELEGGVLEVSYTVEDSWGRKATGKRKISPKKVEQEEVKQEEPKIIREEINLRTGNQNNSTSQATTGLAANVITVEGTPYFNGQHERFQIRFDTAAKQIQIAEQDGRRLSNTGNNEYFRFVLYDKDMNEKASVSLLGNDKSDSDKLDKIANQLYEEGDFIGIWHAETKLESETSDEEKKETSPSFVPKLKIGGIVRVLKKDNSGDLIEDTAVTAKDYSNGMDKREVSERRFQITSDGLKELINTAPVFENLENVSISRGGEFKPLDGIKEKIKDDFDKFDDDNLDTKAVSITYSSYDVKKVGEQTITYTATDKWGRSSTKTRKLTVTSQNPLDTKYIEFKKNNEGNNGTSLFKIKFDPVEKKFLVDNLDAVQEEAIDPTISSSIFKLKVYTQGGVLQKTLNIKGTDNLKTILKKFDGYTYNVGDRIELWSSTPKSIVIHGVDRVTESNGSTNGTVQSPSTSTPGQGSTGNLPQTPSGGENSGETSENAPNGSGGSENNGEEASGQNVREGNLTQSSNSGELSSTNKNDSDNYENYENGIDNSDFMKNVRFEIESDKLTYIYNEAPKFEIADNVELEVDRNGNLTTNQLMAGLTVKDDHDGDSLTSKVIIGNLDTTTIGEKEVEYRVVDSWGRSSLVKRKVTVYPLNSLEYNYITLRNNETFDPILTIRLNDETKKFVVDKIDRSKIPSSLSNDTKVFELKLIRKKNENSSAKASEENSVGKGEEVIGTITLTKEDLMNDEKIKKINELSYQYSDYISLWVYDSEDGIFISGKSDVILNGFEASGSQEAMKNTRFEIQKTGLKSIYNEAPKINGLDKKLYVYKNDDITQAVATRDLEVKDDSGEVSIDSIEVTDVDGNIVKTEKSESNLKNKFKFKLKSKNSNDDNYIETDEIREFKLNYKVTDAWGRSATYQRTVSVISRSVSNDIEFYNKAGSENLFSLKYNPITNTFDVSKKKNTTPSQGEQEPGESEAPSEQPSQGEGNSNGEQLQTKTGDVNQGNETEEVPPQSDGEGSSSGGSSTEPGENHPGQEPPIQNPDNSQDGEQSGGTGGSNNQQTKDEIVFKLTVFNVDEQEVGKIELTEEKAKNIDELKKELEKITIYDDYYVALWSKTPKRIRIQGEVKDNDKLGELENEKQDYSQIINNRDYIDNVRFNLTEDGIHVVYNKAPKIKILNTETLTAYAGDIIDYTKNIEVKDDRDNPTGNHVIDNSKIKITIVPKEANSGGTQPDGNPGSSTEIESSPNSGSGGASSSENTEQTTENEEEALINDEPSSGSGDSGEDNDQNENDSSSEEDDLNKTEEEKFLEEQKKHLKIGNNKVRLTVADSWGRTTTIERDLLIKNGIDKNEIIFKSGSGQEPIRIKFNHETKKLNITTKDQKFSNSSNPDYVKISVHRPNENGVGATVIVPEIRINASQTVTASILQNLKNYTFKYGDYFEIYHGHPQLFYITGGINDQREDYTDGVQNPENLLNVKFEITESGLKSIYTNPDKNNINNNKVVFGPVAQEKFPFKIQIDFENQKFKVVEATGTELKYGDSSIVYKIALIRKESNGSTRIVRQNEFRGNDFGKRIMSTTDENRNLNNEDKNWNGQSFQYDDCLYLWHDEPNRSIIKGNIKKAREDYSNGVDDADNMNHVVFRLTREGLESIYNEAPKIIGANDIDIYQGENFNPSDKVTYSDDHDNGHLTISISPNTINTSELGEKTISYTVTDRWRKTTTVERKVTVRPNLYKNVFKVYPQIGNEQAGTKPGENGDSNSSIESPNPGVTTSPNSNLRTGNIVDSNLNSGSESSENTGSNSSSSGSNSSTQNKPWQYEENKNRKPAFEIGFDTITNKYKVYNQTNERLSNDKLDETAFAIQIKSEDGTEKKKIILNGNDRGTSPKLSELNDVRYDTGDVIRVYRSDLKGIEITGTVTGDIPTNDQMNNDNNKFDYMKNTGFKVSNDGLSAKYNKAPVINGVKKVRTISKGTVDLLQGVTVRDEIDTDISVNSMYIYVNDELIGTTNQNRNSSENSHRYYDFNKVGTYKVKYLLYDKWERTTMIETTVKVESKTRENEIKVYGPNDLNSTSNPSFRITFDTKNNKILLKGPSEESIVDKEDRDDAIESANQENNNLNNNQTSENQDSSLARTSTENYFEIVVRSSKGKEKANISLNGNTEHDKEQLKNLHELQFDKYDTISLKAQNPNAVKVTGNIISENPNRNSTVANSYENGFGTTDKYSKVRFKITDDGLKEIAQKELTINGATAITIKRGDTLDLLEGVSVNVNDENNDDYELTVKEITSNTKTVTIEEDENNTDDLSQNGATAEDKNKFTKLKEGTYTVRYTATNSWGATTTVDREITVKPRTELEAVKLTVKDYLGEDILIIGFDSITRKLRVIDYKNKSIDYLDNSQVFEINAFDSLGKTLGTIALRGDQEIDKSIIDRINAFPYEEGYSLSVWSKKLENRINIDGTIKVDNSSVDNSSKEESKKIRYKRNLSAEQKKDKMENGRFEILSDGLKYIYNEAPKFEGDTSTAIPYYKGNLLKAPDTLTITDDHDGTISTTEVTVNDDNVDYDTLGIQKITYVVEDSWGRRAEKEGKIEIRSAMDSNSINIYPKENSTTGGSASESTQQPNPSPEGTTQGESSQTRTTGIEDGSEGTENGNISEGNNPGNNEGQLQPPQEGENTSTPSVGGNDSDSENNKDNVIVTESSFSIKFVRDNEHNKNRIKVDLGSKSRQQFDSSNAGTFLKVKIYDANGSELKSVDILGTDTGEKAKQKIENELNKVNSDSESKDETEGEETEQQQTKTSSDIEDSTESSTNSANGSPQGGGNSSNKNDKQFEYFNGQYISIEGVTESTMKSVKIQGTVVNKDKDVTYDTGVSNLDKIQNVRFKFTDLGLEAVYNKAPIIKIDKNIKLDGTERKNKSNVEESSSERTETSNEEDFDGIKGDDFNYLRGVTVSDDHDTLTKDNVEVKWNNKFDGDTRDYNDNKESALTDNPDGEYTLAGNGIKVYGQQIVGDNVLYYKVTDSWGRVSYEQRKNIKLKNGAFEDNIKFGNNNYGDDKLSLKFNKIVNDTEEKVQLQLTANGNDNYFASQDADFEYYKIEVWVPNNDSSNSRTHGYRRLDESLTFKGNQTPQQVNSQIQRFNQLKVPYGTILKIYSGHPQLFSIDGPVRNQLEDYSDKVQNPENIVNTVFKITDEGLKAIYVTPGTDSINDNENLISLVAPEKIPLKIKVSNNGTSGGSFSIVDSNATRIDNGVDGIVFIMELKGHNGNRKGVVQIRGNVDGNDRTVTSQFNNLNYVYGDTLTIWHRTPKKVLIKGKVENAREDYSDGVDNSLNLTESVFKLTENGLVATYKSAPQIMGIIDMQVEKGESIDYQTLKKSVTAKDNIDGKIENIQYGNEDIDTSKVGMYEFTYTVTNSNRRTTTKSSTITVYDKPTITTNENATIELNSVTNEEIKDYLKTAVVASDDDDKLYGKETKVEVKDNNVNPNEPGTYEATYVATDLYGRSTTEKKQIQVVRTINVTVPTKLPFQVVTNLMPSEDKDSTVDETTNGFVSGVLKLKNNNTSPVKVSVASFAKIANSGELEIVDPKSCNWDDMNEQDSMRKMALGIYVKNGTLQQSNYNTESSALWLSTNKQNSDTANPDSPGDSQEPSSRTGTTEDTNANEVNVINQELGVLPRRATRNSDPAEASIGFTSKHGKNFIGGSVKGKFKLIFKFE